MPVAVNILFDKVWVTLDDQRVIGLPLVSFPWLEKATPEQQRNYQASPISIYWPDLEDGIDVTTLPAKAGNFPEHARRNRPRYALAAPSGPG